MTHFSFHSPLGAMSIIEKAGSIISIKWEWKDNGQTSPLLREAYQQLNSYFHKKLTRFDLPLAPQGTLYQKKIWETLQTIPYGETRFYNELAKDAGGSARSAGNANGANPIPIIIPCHRVIGKQNLGGYSGAGGITTKRFLLELEGIHCS